MGLWYSGIGRWRSACTFRIVRLSNRAQRLQRGLRGEEIDRVRMCSVGRYAIAIRFYCPRANLLPFRGQETTEAFGIPANVFLPMLEAGC